MTLDNISVPNLVSIMLDTSVDVNTEYPLPGVDVTDRFVILGEVAHAPDHYILARYASRDIKARPLGIMPGIYELYRFKDSASEDVFSITIGDDEGEED